MRNYISCLNAANCGYELEALREDYIDASQALNDVQDMLVDVELEVYTCKEFSRIHNILHVVSNAYYEARSKFEQALK